MSRMNRNSRAGGVTVGFVPADEFFVVGVNAFDKFGRPELVLLSFERRYDLIDLEPVTENVPNTFPIVQESNGRHRVICADLFCRHLGINFAGTIASNTPEINVNGVLVLNLREIRAVSKPRRAESGTGPNS